MCRMLIILITDFKSEMPLISLHSIHYSAIHEEKAIIANRNDYMRTRCK